MFTRSRTPNVVFFAAAVIASMSRLHHADAQTCNCSCDASIPPTLDVAAAFMNEGPGGPTAYVTAGRGNPCRNTEIRHANQIAFGGTTITHFCVNLKYPNGQQGDTAYAFLAQLDPNNANFPGNVIHETPFTVIVNGGHQLVQLTTPVPVTGTLWAGVRYPSARCNITHQGVGPRNQGRAAVYISGPGGAGGGGGWRDYDSAGSGFYTGKAPLIRPLSLVPAGAGGGVGVTGCRIIVGPRTNAAGLLETTELGGSDFVSVQLSQAPLAPVTVNIHSTNLAEGIVSTSSLLFDAGNWISPQFFTVHGIDDPLPDGNANYRVEFQVFSADPCYNQLPVPAIGCVNIDDETNAVLCRNTWTPVAPLFGAIPAALADPTMTYDSYRNVAVMFGGPPGLFGPGETWEWDGSQWKLVTVSGPSSRTNHAMVFDSFRNVVVLMGGVDAMGFQLSDTWEYDGMTWTQKSAGMPNAPGGPRVDHAMAFDTARGLTVLFGGDPLLGPNQVWEWNGSTWTPRPTATTPTQRSQHVMTYDAHRQRVLLFSGFLNNPPFVENEVWEYNGSNWSIAITGGSKPTPRTDATLVHDPIRGVSILFGGNAGGGNLSDAWEWDGLRRLWNPIPGGPSVPSSRSRHAMAFDVQRRVGVLFGGDNGGGFSWTSDTWLYDPTGPLGLPTNRYFLVRGFGSGLPYSWGLSLYNINNLAINQFGFFPGMPASGIVSVIAGQINASNCTQLMASQHNFSANLLQITTTSPHTYNLSFGAAGGLPACGVSPFNLCAFNPTITEVFLDGVDCNANGMDDTIDLANDESLDLNGNGVIDSCEVVSTGDLNCDGAVNAIDIPDFVQAILDPGMYALLHPECSVQRADTNTDGLTDGRDIADFVRLLGL